MPLSYLILFAIIIAGIIISVLKKKLTLIAALTGGLLAIFIFTGAGFMGVALLAIFFIMGVSATAWKFNIKIKDGLAESGNGRRNGPQVFANAGVAAILALLAKYDTSSAGMLQLMIAGSFSAATADTLSSELGNIYGRRYYRILSFREMPRGANGAVSLQGTVAGIFGSTAIAVAYVLGSSWNAQHLLIIIVAGTLGNMVDSMLGLTLENKGLLTNNTVNFLNTAVGAVVAGILYKL